MPDRVTPRGTEDELITHYEYYGSSKHMGEFVVLKKQDLVHIRQGIDPNNHRRGFAPLKSVFKELLGDEAAGQYATALLHNMAVFMALYLRQKTIPTVVHLETKQKLSPRCTSPSSAVLIVEHLWY